MINVKAFGCNIVPDSNTSIISLVLLAPYSSNIDSVGANPLTLPVSFDNGFKTLYEGLWFISFLTLRTDLRICSDCANNPSKRCTTMLNTMDACSLDCAVQYICLF